MSFSEFGQLLRETREKKGLSINDIALKLRINAKFIHAMEEGNISATLHGTYISSFIRTYGNFLELDPDIIKDITSSIDVENLNEYTLLSTNHNNYTNTRLKCYIAIVIFLLIVSGGIWYLIQTNIIPLSFNSSDLLTIVKPTPTQQIDKPVRSANTAINNRVHDNGNLNNVIATNNSIIATQKSVVDDIIAKDTQKSVVDDIIAKDNTTNNENKEDVLPLKQNDALKEATNAQILANADNESNVAELTANQSQNDSSAKKEPHALKEAAQENTTNSINNENTNISENENANIDANTNIDVNGLNRIIITALEECWIHSSADGTNTRQFTLLKGSTFALAFSEKLVLKFGNAGGVRIHYNGKDIPPVGKIGEVTTVTFPPEQE